MAKSATRRFRPERLVFISAAEPSADMHGAALIKAIHSRQPDVVFAGVPGPRMREAGCWMIGDMTGHSAMLLGVVGNAGRALSLLRKVDRYAEEFAFDLAILLDSPMLHLPMAKKLRRRNVPVFYYIAPQLWAWGEHRIGRVRTRINRMAVILPFEQEYFRQRGIDATFVGHPLFDYLAGQTADAARVADLRADHWPIVTILPGSRRHVVEEVLPGQLEVASAIAKKFPAARFWVSVAGAETAPAIRRMCGESPLLIDAVSQQNPEILTAADLVLVASGTATLEVAYYGKPMIVMYNSSRWGYRLIGKRLIRTPYLSLVNILAGKELVPEFMPYYESTDPIAERAIELLSDSNARKAMSAEMAKTIAPLVKPGASQRVADMALEMMSIHRFHRFAQITLP